MSSWSLSPFSPIRTLRDATTLNFLSEADELLEDDGIDAVGFLAEDVEAAVTLEETAAL